MTLSGFGFQQHVAGAEPVFNKCIWISVSTKTDLALLIYTLIVVFVASCRKSIPQSSRPLSYVCKAFAASESYVCKAFGASEKRNSRSCRGYCSDELEATRICNLQLKDYHPLDVRVSDLHAQTLLHLLGNMALLVARAIDMGVRLVIVTSGSLTSLRNQTQRRFMSLFPEGKGSRYVWLTTMEHDVNHILTKINRRSGNGTTPKSSKKKKEEIREAFDREIIQGPGQAQPIEDKREAHAQSPSTKSKKKQPVSTPLAHDYEKLQTILQSDHEGEKKIVVFAVVKKNAKSLGACRSVCGEDYLNLQDKLTLFIDDESDDRIQKRDLEKNSHKNAVPDTLENLIKHFKGGVVIPKKLAVQQAAYIGYTATPQGNLLMQHRDWMYPDCIWPL
eukprot:g77180.t1